MTPEEQAAHKQFQEEARRCGERWAGQSEDGLTLEERVVAALRRIVIAAHQYNDPREEEHTWYTMPPGYIDSAEDALERYDKARKEAP